MDNLEPIELEVLIKNEELLQEFKKMIAATSAFDGSIDQTKRKFNEFVQTQLKASAVLSENASLTEKQTNAIKRHYEALDYLKEKIAETTDPTQLGIFNFQLKQAEQAIKDIVEAANTKVELLNAAQLEEQNKKLEHAGRVLDQINDKSFEFANPQELEVLSQAINSAENELEQLGVLVDFVSAKMQSSDMSPETLAALKEDIKTANEMLGRTPTIYETAGNSINQLTDALKNFQEELSEATNPEDIVILNQNIENIEAAINQLKSAGKTGFDELGNKIAEQKPKTVQLQTELENLIQKMASLRIENKANSDEYENLKNRATEIRAALVAINQEVNAASSSTGGLDTLIRFTSTLSAGFTLAQGSAALFGSENENVQETIKKVTAAMAVLQSLQQIQTELRRADSIATTVQTVAHTMYARVIGQSTGALKSFRIALAATGIGIFIILLAELVSNWDKVKKAIGLTSDELERNQAIGKKAVDLYGEKISKIQLLVELNKQEGLTTRQKESAVKDFNKEFGTTLGSVKDYAELERRIIANAPKYIEYLNVKAQAEAAYILSLEKQKHLLEQITALSTGDIKWYEKLQNASDKASNSFWSVFGVKTKTQYDISVEEQLRILGLPTEEEFKKALTSYSAVIQDNLKDMRKQQNEDSKLVGASLGLQKKAADLANSLGIKEDEKKTKTKTDKTLKERLDLLKEIENAENEYLANSLSGLDRDLKEIEQKYTKMRSEAEKLKLSAKDIERINALEVKEKDLVTYKDSTEQMLKQLDKEKELFKLFEQAKTLIGAEEITKRYQDQLQGFKTFGERLQSEINLIEQTPEKDRTGSESERLKKLLELKREYEKEAQELEDDRYLSTFENNLTLQERISQIENDYIKQRNEIEKIADEQLRNEKLNHLDAEKYTAINNVKEEYSQRLNAERRLLTDLSNYTKRELKARIKSIEEYLKEYGNLLSVQERAFVDNELQRAKTVLGITALQTEENALLNKKNELEKEIKSNKAKGLQTTSEELNRLNEINVQLDEIGNKKLAKVANYLGLGANLAADIGFAFKGVNAELSQTMAELSEFLNDLGNIVARIAEGDTVGAIAGIVNVLIKGFQNVLGSAEERRQRREQMEIQALRNQAEYNRLLREQLLIESRLDDDYQSRVQAIKDEIDVLKSNKETIANEMRSILKQFHNYFQDMGRMMISQNKAGFLVWASLGLNEYFENGVELSDELLDKLMQLNNVAPLEGQMKELFDQLMRLKDEFGSIDEAMRELEKEWKNIVTGTTADSLANSIKEGIASGKRSFSDFADDIEGFLRNAILAGMSTKIIEPQMQKLQDMLYEMMGDGIMSEDERKRFQEMYMRIVNEAKGYLDMINEAGIDITGSNQTNSLNGAIKGITEEQADLLAGQFGGLRLAQLETNQILKASASYQMASYSHMIELQLQIEINTKETADNTENIVGKLQEIINMGSGNASLQANGLWTL